MSCPLGNDCDWSNCPDRRICEANSVDQMRGTQERLNQILKEHPGTLIRAQNQVLQNRL